jgi:iron complex transport system permease protein
MRGKRKLPVTWLLAGLAILAACVSLAVGSVSIPLGTVVKALLHRLPFLSIPADWPDSFETILFDLRFPRTILIALTGASLAGSGAAYQGLFRNPLADPYLIGVASGAGLGAVAAMSLHWPTTTAGYFSVPLAAFIGGSLTVALVYVLARVGKTVPTTNLLLAGITIGSFCTALTSFLMIQSQGELRRAIIWLMGGVSTSSWGPVLAVLPYTLIGLALLFTSGKALNVLQFGEEQAQQMGLNTGLAKTLVIIGATLAAASAVAFSGIIGFIGLIVPHILRMATGPDYRRLIPLSTLAGVSVLLATDVLARVVIPPQEVPLGIITTLAGAPFFLWVLRRSKNQAFW